jgi:repressor LexA
MQALSVSASKEGYNGIMPGRPSSRPRTPFGQRLLKLREAAGLSQAQVAEKLGIAQRSYAAWERDPVALQPDTLAKLARILAVPVGQLMGDQTRAARHASEPKGKMRLLFDAASKLPRSQQQKIIAVLEAFVTAQHAKAS